MVPVVVHETFRLVATCQASPPLGDVTVIVFGTTRPMPLRFTM